MGARDSSMTVIDSPSAGPDQPGLPAPAPVKRRGSARDLGDVLFRRLLQGGGIIVLLITGSVGLFLMLRASTALKVAKFKFITTQAWQPDVHKFGIAAILTGTVLIALVAVIVATPLAIGTALFISEVAPRRAKQLLITGVDLMFAVPSVVYGLWGFLFFERHVVGVSRWLA